MTAIFREGRAKRDVVPDGRDVPSVREPVYASLSVREAGISRVGFGSRAIVGHGVHRQIDTTVAIGSFH